MWESDWLQILGSGRLLFLQRQMGRSDPAKYLSVGPWCASGLPWMLALDHALRGLFSNHKLPSSKF